MIILDHLEHSLLVCSLTDVEFGITASPLWMCSFEIFASLLGFWRRRMLNMRKRFGNSVHKTKSGNLISVLLVCENRTLKYLIALNSG